jgi:type II secretion system protein J
MKLSHTNRSKAEAFTLLEVLLAVGIFAIVLFAMNTVFFSALRLERATNRAVDERLPLNQALAVVRRDLQGAVPPNTNSTLLPRHFVASASGGGFGAAQSGSLEFYTTTGALNDAEPWGDLQRIRFELVDPVERSASSTGRELVRRVLRNVLATSTEEEVEELLASDVESLEFQCYDGSDWTSVWDTEAGDVGLPQAVRVRVHLAANNAGGAKLTQEPLELLVPLVTQTLTNSIAGGGQ